MNKKTKRQHRSSFICQHPYGSCIIQYTVFHNYVILSTKDHAMVYRSNELDIVESILKKVLSNRRSLSATMICQFSDHDDYRAAKNRFTRDQTSYKRIASIIRCCSGLGLESDFILFPSFVELVNTQTRCTPYGEHSTHEIALGLIIPEQIA
jgi:hypothetical protein